MDEAETLESDGIDLSSVPAEETGKKSRKSKKEVDTQQNSTSNLSKLEALNKIRGDIEKKYGKTSIFKFDDKLPEVPLIQTNILGLDSALGGGIPRGRVIEIYGPPSVGKSLLAALAISQEQKRDKACAYIDAERSLNPEWLNTLGVNFESLLVAEPDAQEQAFQIIEDLVTSQAISLIVVDSSNSLIPQAELDGEFGDSHMGLQARGWSQFLRRITGLLAKNNVTLIILSQLRQKIGSYNAGEAIGVGTAIGFYASQRLDVRKVETINGNTADDDPTGTRIRIKLTKNKVAPPFKKCELVVSFESGISVLDDTLDQGIKYGVIQKSGSWFSYGEERLGQGSKNVVALFKSNPELYEKIFEEIKVKMKASKE